MGALSRLIQNTVLDIMAGRASSFSTSGEVWAQLHHGGSPGVDGTANVASGFSRQQVTWGTPTARKVVSASDILFSNFGYQESGSPYISLWDASTNGSFLGADQATPPSVIDPGESWLIPAGQLELKATDTQASDQLVHRVLNTVIGAAAFTGSDVGPYLQIHTADPGANGTDNIAPVYNLSTGAAERLQSPSWPNPAANGIVESVGVPANWGWEVRGSGSMPLGITTLWDAATGGNFLGKRGAILSNLFYPGDRWLYPTNVPVRFTLMNTF